MVRRPKMLLSRCYVLVFVQKAICMPKPFILFLGFFLIGSAGFDELLCITLSIREEMGQSNLLLGKRKRSKCEFGVLAWLYSSIDACEKQPLHLHPEIVFYKVSHFEGECQGAISYIHLRSLPTSSNVFDCTCGSSSSFNEGCRFSADNESRADRTPITLRAPSAKAPTRPS